MRSRSLRYLTGALAALAVVFGGCSVGDSEAGVEPSGKQLIGAETIDFEGLNAGDIVDEVFGDGGSGPIAVSGVNPGFPDDNAAMIYDSSCPPDGRPFDCSGADADLGTPNETFGGPGRGAGGEVDGPNPNGTAQGNLLIVSEDLDSNDPDDADVVGSTLVFDFSALGSVRVESMVLIDVEPSEPNTVVRFNDDPSTDVELPDTGDNGKIVFDFGGGPVGGVTKMEVIINGSGAIDSVIFEPEAPFCGDGNIDEGETCDPPGQPEGQPNECREDCTFCGDGNVDPTEECDDGNNQPGDGCDPFCNVEPFCGDGNIDEGETCDPPGQPEGQPNECREDCTFCGDGNVDPTEECDDGNNEPGDGCDPFCNVERGDQGCTPGYYKQSHHLCEWEFDPDDLFDDVFMVDAPGNDTLLQALSKGGGGETAFQRHAVAALLNAANGGVFFQYSVDEVKAIVQEAYMTGDFEALKYILEKANTAGCPLANCK